MTNPNLQVEQELVFHEARPKKKVWLWWLSGCAILVCISLGIIAFRLFSLSDESSDPLGGKVAFPSTVKYRADFDFVITLTNSTTKPIFIKHIVFFHLLDAPFLLDGARVISIEPNMASEPLNSRDVKYSYFREIKPGETQTVTLHMRAENMGTYYGNIGVYAKDPLHPKPAFIQAFHFTNAEIEITP